MYARLLVYGRLPRGLTAVLTESWTGDINLTTRFGLKKFQKMKLNLGKALIYASEHSKEKQLQYTNQYNKREEHKAFEPGENVIVLYPTSSNKLISRWHGPCTILERRSRYSNLMYMGIECIKIIHTNKIRKYYTRAMAFGLIAEEDEEFGSVVEVNLNTRNKEREH